MKYITLPTDPDFSQIKRSPSIDFVKFSSKTFSKPPLPATRCKTGYFSCSSGYGMWVTIHNPTAQDIEIAAAHLDSPEIIELEVSLDFRPKGNLAIHERASQMEGIRRWLLAHLYPWDGPGLQFSHRVSRKKGHYDFVLADTIMRSVERNETLYFGHAKARYADPDLPNYAFMRIYEKKKDMGKTLLPIKTSVRVEVNLNLEGCRHFQLHKPTDLLGFNFRELSDYFRLVKPVIWLPKLTNLRRRNPKFAEVIERALVSLKEQRAKMVGAWSLHGVPYVLPTAGRHTAGNRMIGIMFDNLTKKFRRGSSSAENPLFGSW